MREAAGVSKRSRSLARPFVLCNNTATTLERASTFIKVSPQPRGNQVFGVRPRPSLFPQTRPTTVTANSTLTAGMPRPNAFAVNRKPEVGPNVREDFAKQLKELAERHNASGPTREEMEPTKEAAADTVLGKVSSILNSGGEFSKNPILSAGGSSSAGAKKFSPLRESDLAGNAQSPSAFCPAIPSVSPVLGPLIPPSGSHHSKRSSQSQSIVPSGLRVQDLELASGTVRNSAAAGNNIAGRKPVVSKSTDVGTEKNYYARYSMAMEKDGFFSNRWFIPATKRPDGKFVSLEAQEFELYKSYSCALRLSKGITIGMM